MLAHELKRSKGLKNKKVRVGRGNSSKGNYSGKGLKGQKARSGYSKKPFFEGGQTPLLQRLPKLRGFKRYYKLVKNYVPVNLGVLQTDERVKSGDLIDKAKLVELGYIKKESKLVKILADGSFDKKLKFKGIEAFSKKAKDLITAAGGEIEEIKNNG